MEDRADGVLLKRVDAVLAAGLAGLAAAAGTWVCAVGGIQGGWGLLLPGILSAGAGGGFLLWRARGGAARLKGWIERVEAGDRLALLVDRTAGALEEFARAHTVFRSQLEGVTGQTEQAAMDIVSRLDELDRSMKDLLGYLAESIEETDRISRRLIERQKADREAVRRMHEYLEHRKAELELDWERVENVLQRSRELLELTELVREVAAQTNLLALNARIEAARAGAHGRGFAVVADEVRKLSVQSERAADRIEQGIRQMIDTIQAEFSAKLNENERARERDMLVSVDDQISGMGALEDQCTLLHQEALRAIQERSQKVAGLVLDTLGQIQFQDVTRQRVEQVVEALERIDAHIDRLVDAIRRRDPDVLPEDGGFSADAMRESYVMQAQRDTHADAVGKDGGSRDVPEQAGPAIELF